MNIENFLIIGDRTSKISVPLTEKWFILNKWRKKLCLFDGKKIYTQQMTEVRFFVVASIPWEKWSIYSGQSDTEGTMINQLQYELQFDPSIVVLLLVSIEWNDGSAKRSKTAIEFVCFEFFACQQENFSLYGDVNSTAEELQIFWTLMF